MQKIVLHLCCDGAAEEAVRLLAGPIPGSSTGTVTRYPAPAGRFAAVPRR